MGNPLAVRVGPGILKIAPIGTTEPTDLSAAWNAAWIDMGYTDTGSSFVFEATFEDVVVAEEYDPIATLQTTRTITVNFALAELTAENLSRAMNGGTVDTSAGVVKFEPPAAGDYTPVMLGWEADDGMERWVFRKAVQVGSVEIARRKAPDKATIPMSFRCSKPAAKTAFVYYHDANWTLPLGS